MEQRRRRRCLSHRRPRPTLLVRARRVALERLLERKRPLTVGVFANNDPEEINELVDECGIDLIQLSGGEPWGHCLLVARQVIKVVHVAEADDGDVDAGTVRDRQRHGRDAG